VVIAGSESHVDEIASVLRRESWLGYNVIGAMLPEPGERPQTHSGIPVLGSARSIAEIAIDAEADVVFLASGAVDSGSDMRRLAWDLEHEDVAVVIAPSVTDVSSERVSVRPVGGMPLIHLEKPRSAEAVRRAKRIFDIVGSLCLLTFFSPIFAFSAYKVWRYDRGSILFRQTRVGRDGKTFYCWKFRTMVTNAEELLADLHKAQGYEGGLFKMEDDPRITPPGKWLRRLSLDELPQLVNVLVGDMSLVGPRPPLRHEVAQYDDDMARRLRVRPGMTGLWQVSGRSELSWSEAIRLDLYYVDNWSMFQDLSILARTWGAVFGSRGAY
jgi:exopolysaccharide biosynthesis polyprenyl glycosylphosphotransferase